MRARPKLCFPVGKHGLLLDLCRSLFSVRRRYSQKSLVILLHPQKALVIFFHSQTTLVTKTATEGLHTGLWPSAFHHFHVSWSFVHTAISCLYRIVYTGIVLPRWTVYSFYVCMILFNMFFAFSCLVPPPPHPHPSAPPPHHHPHTSTHPAPLLFFPTQ